MWEALASKRRLVVFGPRFTLDAPRRSGRYGLHTNTAQAVSYRMGSSKIPGSIISAPSLHLGGGLLPPGCVSIRSVAQVFVVFIAILVSTA